MKLGFINFSSEEQLKMHQVIQAIQEHQAIDELGLGRIRDAFSNKLFPDLKAQNSINATCISQNSQMVTGSFRPNQDIRFRKRHMAAYRL